MVQLAQHQTNAISAILAEYLLMGNRRQVLHMATGSGKTYTAAALADLLFNGEQEPHFSGRCLFLAHRDTLLEQAFATFAQYFPLSQLGIVQGEKHYPAAPVVFASVQTLAQARRLTEVLRYGAFDLVICDECHHATAPSYRTILGTMKSPQTRVMSDDALLVGLTATPRRSDNISLRTVFESVTYSVGMLELITAEPEPWLVDLREIAVEIPDLHLSQLTNEDEEGDFNQEELARAIEQSVKSRSRYTGALDVLQRYPEIGRLQGVYFGGSVADAYGFADMANAAGITTEVVTGKTPEEERHAIYDRVRRGETQYLSNMNVLPEGVDLPMLKVCIIGYHTKFIGRWIQMVGRISRIHPVDRGKPSKDWQYPMGYVISLTDHEHTVVMLPDLVGSTEETVKQRSVRELANDKAIKVKPEPMIPVYTPGSRLRIAGSSVFTSQPWQRAGQDYRLKTQDGVYLARHTFEGNTYDLLFYPKDGKMRQLKKPLPLEQALGFGEQFVQQANQRRANREDPEARRQPASAKQIETLARTFKFIKPGMPITQGGVRDAWDLLKKYHNVAGFYQRGGVKEWYAKHAREVQEEAQRP